VTDHSEEDLGITISDRGFKRLSAIPSEYGGHVEVYESSAAMAPYIWLKASGPVSLNDPDGPSKEVFMHLTIENAERLAGQLHYLVTHHYQEM
jgi:hypothetical protein